MQRAQTQHGRDSHVEQKSQWHPFSWRRMNSRNVWILLAAALAFILIGLAVT